MDLVTFGLGITTEATRDNGFGNLRAGNHYWDTLGRQREAMDLVTSGWESPLGHAWEATGGNGFGNFRVGNHYWDTLGRQREAMDLVTFGLGITTGTRLGGNGKQWIW